MNEIQSWSQDFDPSGKVWIYTLSRALSAEESTEYITAFNEFVKSWKDHKNSQWGEMKVFNSQVLIIAANNQPSGCSMDSLRQWINEFASKMSIQIFAGQVLVFTNKNEIILKNRLDLNVNALLNGTLWINTGISGVKSLQNGEWLREPKEIF